MAYVQFDIYSIIQFLLTVESDWAVTLFERSYNKLGLTYKTHIVRGDSKSYSTVAKAMPYGPLVHIAKEECVSHITKRIGSSCIKL